MSKISVDLPVGSPGTPGAGQDVSALGAAKDVQVDGPASIDVDIEFSEDNANWFRLRKVLVPGKYKLFVAANWMRASIPAGASGSPTNIDAASNRDGTRQVSVPIPTAPGVGASVDITSLGDDATFLADGLSSGEVILEGSEDDTSFFDCFTVDSDAPFRSGELTANFVRARRVGGSGETITGTLRAQDPSATTSSAAAGSGRIVYRPDATGANAPGGNVYTDWQSAYDAARAATAFGQVELEFDNRFSTHLNGNGDKACPIPAGAWDFDKITWWAGQQPAPFIDASTESRVDILEGAVIDNLYTIDGPASFYITYDGETGSPIFVTLLYVNNQALFDNTNANAAPMFRGAGFSLLVLAPRNSFGGVGAGADATFAAPLIDATDTFFTVFQLGGTVAEDVAIGNANSVFFQVKNLLSDGYDPVAAGLFHQPTLTAAGGTAAARQRMESGHRVAKPPTPITDADSPYTLDTWWDTLLVDSTGGPVDITIPETGPAVGSFRDQYLRIIDIGGAADVNNITVNLSGADVFDDGSTSQVIATSHGVLVFNQDTGTFYRETKPAVGTTGQTGAAPTLGNIDGGGEGGPAAAAQAGWAQINVDGVLRWVPVWA